MAFILRTLLAFILILYALLLKSTTVLISLPKSLIDTIQEKRRNKKDLDPNAPVELTGFKQLWHHVCFYLPYVVLVAGLIALGLRVYDLMVNYHQSLKDVAEQVFFLNLSSMNLAEIWVDYMDRGMAAFDLSSLLAIALPGYLIALLTGALKVRVHYIGYYVEEPASTRLCFLVSLLYTMIAALFYWEVEALFATIGSWLGGMVKSLSLGGGQPFLVIVGKLVAWIPMAYIILILATIAIKEYAEILFFGLASFLLAAACYLVLSFLQGFFLMLGSNLLPTQAIEFVIIAIFVLAESGRHVIANKAEDDPAELISEFF